MAAITPILKKYKLLDSEDYLIPPENPAVMALIHKIVKLRTIVGDGKKLTPEQRDELRDMEAAKDYYDEALEDELRELDPDATATPTDEAEEADEYEVEEEDEDEPEGEPVATPDDIEEEDEDASYEP